MDIPDIIELQTTYKYLLSLLWQIKWSIFVFEVLQMKRKDDGITSSNI